MNRLPSVVVVVGDSGGGVEAHKPDVMSLKIT